MNTPRPPMEPLDEQEREFARILRALPAGEPPPALDAAILRAATNAAASSKRPGARIFASAGALWGIGSAAAAVLALGVAWQLRYGETRAPLAESAPRAHVVADRADDEPVQVELGPASETAPAPMSPPPPPPPLPQDLAQKEAPQAPLRRQRVVQPERDATPAAVAAAPAPEAFAADQLDEHVARESAAAANAAAESARAEAELEMKGRSEEASSKLAAKRADAPPPLAAAAAPTTATADAQSRNDAGNAAPVGQASASGSALGGLADSSARPAARKPATWLTEIRTLRDQGRIEEARAALIEFRKKYPKWVIPTDLAPLLSE